MSTDFPVLEFVLRNYKNFNARATRDARSPTGATSRAAGRCSGRWRARCRLRSSASRWPRPSAPGLIHGLSVTGANLEESLFRLVAHHSYKDFPEYRYFTKEDDTKILERPHAPRDRHQHPRGRGVPRRREVHRPDVEGRDRERRAPLLARVLLRADPDDRAQAHEGNAEECWLLAAAEAKLPIVVPGYEDSTFGNIFASHVKHGECGACDRQVGHRVHGDVLRPVPRALVRRGRRLLPDRRRHRRRLPDLRRAVDQVRPRASR